MSENKEDSIKESVSQIDTQIVDDVSESLSSDKTIPVSNESSWEPVIHFEDYERHFH